MHLTTERLVIRDWRLDQDVKDVIALYGDPAVTQWIGDKSLDTTAEAVKARLEQYRSRATEFPGLGCWAMEHPENQRAIGTVLLMPLPDRNNTPSQDIEIGWHLSQAYWGSGYATEAACAVMIYGFTALKLSAIYAVTLIDNDRSIRVTQRLGMTDLGISEDYYGGYRLRLFRRSAGAPERK